MSYYNEDKKIKETTQSKTLAIATYEVGAEIIVKALNFYFSNKTFTSNEAVEMMHKNNADSFKKVADHCEKHEYTGEMIIDYLRELAEEMEAQSLVVAMRDELKFDCPKDE
jgi:hypothetical protein